MKYPNYEVWGGYCHNGECDEPRHLEDCFSLAEAKKAAIEYASQMGWFAFVKSKDEET